MDIGKVVSWIQAVIWAVAVCLYVGKLISNGVAPSTLIGKFLASNLLMGITVFTGLLMSIAVLYLNLRLVTNKFDKSGKLTDVRDRAFANEVVDLDGKAFNHCKFENVTYRYNGRAGLGLSNSQLSGSMRLMSDSDAVNGAWIVAKALGLLRNTPFLDSKGEPQRNINDPKNTEEVQQARGPRNKGKSA